MSVRSRRTLGVAVVVFTLLAAGAIGYWTASGSGSATSTVGDAQQLTLAPGLPSTAIAPGRSSAVAAVASNPNPYPVRVESIALDTARGSGGFAVDAGHPGCGLDALAFATQDNGGAGWTIPAGSGATPGTLPIQMPGSLTMAPAAVDACQGATFTVHLRVGS